MLKVSIHHLGFGKEDLLRKDDFPVIFPMQSSETLCNSLVQCLPK